MVSRLTKAAGVKRLLLFVVVILLFAGCGSAKAPETDTQTEAEAVLPAEVILYDANGGERLDGEASGERIAVEIAGTHLRENTAIGTELFTRDGYTQTGWNTKADGSGIHVGFGSRIEWEEGLILYAEWAKWSEETLFSYQESQGFAEITGYSGEEDTICIPATLDGKTVRRIKDGAFRGAVCDTVIFFPGLYEVEKGAFAGCTLKTLYLYDDIAKISDYAFTECENLSTLFINAIEAPVYSGNYFDTFTDKYDRLLALKDKKKIVLFSGSSTRFGYDSSAIDEAFSDYDVVNMGVFAYTPALPQLMLILECMGEEDILVHSPEFDASNRQFCYQTELDYATFAMMESNYDLFALLDIRAYDQVFTAFCKYNDNREDMEKKSYALSASDFDEDGNPVLEKSYNEYGDYCLFRPNADSEEPIYGLPLNYTRNAFPKEQYIDSVNRVYELFLAKGVHVFFTYAPRNCKAVSEESTPAERAALHAYFKENLIVPVISELEDSLVSGTYLYGTDNHLSTEGVAIRTEKIIEEIKAAL